jgi:UDP-N-acetylmuramyl pentapeptide phosphotransferase/UDP-N-acetylglucosamine-1-phosphate transferase
MVLTINIALAITFAVFALSALTTYFLINYLTKKQIMDIPNERSSHETPTPRGGGIAIVISMIVGWCALAFFKDSGTWVITPRNFEPQLILVGALVLALISWIDDKRDLSAIFRLLMHFAVAGFGLYIIPHETLFFGGFLPLWADKILALFIWVWFINLYNFMDGIDGITSVQTISICLSLGFLVLGGSISITLGFYGLVIIGAVFGFLLYNWNPAKIFMGDVGSIPLGFVTGWILLKICGEGAWAAGAIIPAYYLLDATYTLLKRAYQRKRIMQAHKEHIYQRAVQRGLSHGAVCYGIFKLNIGLMLLAAASDHSGKPLAIVVISYLFVATMARRMLTGEKAPTFKELKDEMVSGVKATYKEVNTNYKNIKNQNQENTDKREDSK